MQGGRRRASGRLKRLKEWLCHRSIRPKVVEKRKEVGHFEGDRSFPEKQTEVEDIKRKIVWNSSHRQNQRRHAEECNRVTLGRLAEFPEEYRKTLTQDRGTENFDYKPLEDGLNISCYFAHAYCSKRGSNENLNGLIRRYFPKGTDFSKVTDAEIMRVEGLLNNRPRKRFGGLTPCEYYL